MRILYVTTISNTVNAFLIPHIKMLIDEGHQVDVAFNIDQDVKKELHDMGCKIHQVPFQRSPLKKDNLKAYKELHCILKSEKYDIVHTHTPVASTIVRLVCKNLNNVKVIYTAHGFHFYKGAPLLNWLAYYPVEKWLSKYTDTLITINREDYTLAKNRFKAGHVKCMLGVGIDTTKFKNTVVNNNEKRKDLGIPINCFAILSVGELNKNKNHELVIKAIAKICDKDIHYIVCGQGGLDNYLKELSKKLGVEKQIHFLGFRTDVNEIYKVVDLFVFPSYREGLPVSIMEAMASGLPIVCSKIRGCVDLVDNYTNGCLFEFNKPEKIREYIIHTKTNPNTQKAVGINNILCALNFDIDEINKEILSTYI